MNKPTNFIELLELQRQLDEKTAAARPSGFKPRQRTEFDLRMALDDEFNEFMKELPDELNFKTWKEKKHDPHKQLIEWCDCLFFMLAYVNEFKSRTYRIVASQKWKMFWLVEHKTVTNTKDLEEFKYTDLRRTSLKFLIWIKLSIMMGYKEEDILNAYWEKWNINMGRDKKDWSL